MGVVAAVVGIASGVAGMVSGRKAAKASKRAGRAQAAQSKLATDERSKQLKKDQKYGQSMARARASASGVGGQTTDIYLQALEDAGKEELDWLQVVGESEYDAAITSGEIGATKAMSGFWGSAGGALKSGADLYTELNK